MGDTAQAAERLRALGVRRIESFAWRDHGDPNAGGSEVHADEILARWAAAGVDVTHRTSEPREADGPAVVERRGYRVIRRGGRFSVFARVIAGRVTRRTADDTAIVEIWNGMPFLSPIWAGARRVVWVHHLHRDMWADVMPAPFAALGRFVETSLAPPLYRSTTVATLSASSAEELRSVGLRDPLVIGPGVAERFTAEPSMRSPTPRVVVVGRLAPVKRHLVALEAARIARRTHRALQVDLIGEGPDRAAIDAWVDDHGAHEWVRVRGRVSDDELVACYRRAWTVVSASKAEGWGMSITEAAACGTPAVATDIAGHRSSVLDDVTGRLVPADGLADGLAELLADDALRARMSAAAASHARRLSWDVAAARHLAAVASVVERSRSART